MLPPKLRNVSCSLWFVLLILLLCLRRLEDSIYDFNRAIELDGSNPIIYSNRGLVYRKMDRFENAIDDYTCEIEYGASNNVKAFNNRAYCFAKLGHYDEAIADYSTVLKFDELNIHALHNRGISYERLAKYMQAIKDFSEVIQLDKENANAYFNRGCCYDSVGELDLAISDYSVALELDMKASENQQEDGLEDGVLPGPREIKMQEPDGYDDGPDGHHGSAAFNYQQN